MEFLMPHGFCINWNPELLATFVLSDAIIALSYFSIAFVLIGIIFKINNSPTVSQIKLILYLFSLFIFACGVTHVVSIFDFWHPIYQIQSYILAFTAVVSLSTAVIFIGKIKSSINK